MLTVLDERSARGEAKVGKEKGRTVLGGRIEGDEGRRKGEVYRRNEKVEGRRGGW